MVGTKYVTRATVYHYPTYGYHNQCQSYKKDIDNDNRSDGQSSDMDDTSASSSSTSTSEGEISSGDGVVKEDSLGCINWNGAYSTIG